MNGDKKTHRGIVHWIALASVAIAVPLDLFATVIRMLEGAMQFKFPAAYAGWNALATSHSAWIYYVVEGIALIAVPIGASAAALLTIPLINVIHKRIRAASMNTNKRVKKDMLARLHKDQTHYFIFLAMALVPVALFSLSFFTAGYRAPTKTIMQTVPIVVHGKHTTKQIPVTVGNGPDLSGVFSVITFLADVTAPVLSMIVVMNMEGEKDEQEAQERAMRATTNIIVDGIADVGQSMRGGRLTPQQAAMLKAGTEGDIMGAVNAITDRPENMRVYTITDLCVKFGCDTDKDDPGRKAIYRKVKAAYDAGQVEIIKDAKRGWLVPGKLLDDLFGDWKPPAPMIRLASDRGWTPRPVDTALEAS